LKIESN